MFNNSILVKIMIFMDHLIVALLYSTFDMRKYLNYYVSEI